MSSPSPLRRASAGSARGRSAFAAVRAVPLPPAVQTQLAQLQQRWLALAPRERLALSLALAAVALLLVWNLGVQPALTTLRTVPAQRAVLDAQLAHMQALAQESLELRAMPPVPPDQAEAALRAATARLGAGARLTIGGDRVTVALTAVDATAFTGWLAEVRSGARARVVELQLSRSGSAYSGNAVLALGRPG